MNSFAVFAVVALFGIAAFFAMHSMNSGLGDVTGLTPTHFVDYEELFWALVDAENATVEGSNIRIGDEEFIVNALIEQVREGVFVAKYGDEGFLFHASGRAPQGSYQDVTIRRYVLRDGGSVRIKEEDIKYVFDDGFVFVETESGYEVQKDSEVIDGRAQ